MSFVSVIIPARNAATTIGRTLASLSKDAKVIGEILVVNDGSSDQTAAQATHIAQQLKLPIKIHQVLCSSAGAARNYGIGCAKYPYIYFIDADDVLIPGSLILLADRIVRNPEVSLVIGASVRKTPGLRQLLRIPVGYTADRLKNTELYLRNGSPPIAIGSALFIADSLGDVRFPENITIDEDTWFWSALLERSTVLALEEPIVSYDLDAQRTARRFLKSPRKLWLAIVREFDKFRHLGISKDVLDYRKAWLAQRFCRQLIKHNRYGEARSLLRPVLAHPLLRRELRTIRYQLISGFKQMFEGSTTNFVQPVTPDSDYRTMVISYDPSWPPVSGADLRNFQNAHLAARRGPVLLASIREHEDTAEPEKIKLISFTKTDDIKTSSVNSFRLKSEPRISKLILERLQKAVDDFKPDSVVIEGVFLHSIIPALKHEKCQLIIDMHNVESDLSSQLNERGKPGWRNSLGARWLSRIEANVVGLTDRTWVCTQADRARILSKYGVKKTVDVVPNGIPGFDNSFASKLPRMRPVEATPKLLFVGHLGYPPNVDAVEILVTKIFPKVQKLFPDARLVVVGRYPKPRVKKLAGVRGVELHENPDHVAPFLNQADISVIPLRSGGGSRIKILEAAAFGVPVVATDIAAEGLDLVKDVDLIIANTDKELVTATLQLLQDNEKRRAVRASAFASVRNLYSEENISRFIDDGLGLQ